MPMPPDAEMGKKPAQPQGGGATELVSKINSDMMSLMDLMSQSDAVNPKDKDQYAQIIQMFQNFVQKNLGSAPGQDADEQEPDAGGPVPMMAGAGKVTPAM